MTDKRDHGEPDARAAEQALRLLTGKEGRQAAAAEAHDSEFAAEVARWRGRLAPLFEDVTEVRAPEDLWRRIEESMREREDNVTVLHRSVARWRAAAAGMTALAASLGLILLQPRSSLPPVAVQRPATSPLVAVLGDSDKKMKVVASWDPASRQLVMAIVGEMAVDPRHSHELWVIPSDGKPRSIGTMSESKKAHMRLADTLARLLQQGATIAISVEPPGGSPTGAPTGPVVASGSLDRA